MDLSDLIEKIMMFIRSEAWVIQVFIIVFITLLVDFIQKRIISKTLRSVKKTDNFWDDPIFAATQGPLSLLIWLYGLSFAADIMRSLSEAVIFNAINPIRTVGSVIIVAWYLSRFVQLSKENIIARSKDKEEPVDRTTADAITKLLKLSIYITAIMVILQTLGYSISGVLAFGGISGIAIGFAAKDLLSNFFGGLMLYLDRPFAVGDWIRSPDKEIEGTVETIGWRLTRIRTFDKRPLYVPNSVFNTISVENPSRMTNRRIYETIGIRYDDVSKMDDIIKDVKQMLCDHPEIDIKQTMIVNFNEFAPSSLDFFIYTFTKTTDWIKFHEIKQDVMLKIIRIIEDHGAECAFPTSTVHIPDGLNIQESQGQEKSLSSD